MKGKIRNTIEIQKNIKNTKVLSESRFFHTPPPQTNVYYNTFFPYFPTLRS